MIIGVLKERKRDERRVALRPADVEVLTQLGHKVLVEAGAGASAGYRDEEYCAAELVDRDELYSRATLLVKVKCPLPEEYGFLRSHHILFTFLHFDENISPERIGTIAGSGVTGIAFEWVAECGAYPILQPMSELTGEIFALRAMALLLEHAGVIATPGQRPAAMVIGLGHIGAHAAAVLARNEFALTIVDKHPDTIDARIQRCLSPEEWRRHKTAARIIHFDENAVGRSVEALRAEVPEMDIVINSAVRRPTLPKAACEFLLDRETVARMRPNRVVCDATACDGDFIETAVSSESLMEVYQAEGVIHYNCDHIPSLAARTATERLSRAILPYVTSLAGGFSSAVQQRQGLAAGVMCHQGRITHAYTAKKKALEYTDLADLLQ